LLTDAWAYFFPPRFPPLVLGTSPRPKLSYPHIPPLIVRAFTPSPPFFCHSLAPFTVSGFSAVLAGSRSSATKVHRTAIFVQCFCSPNFLLLASISSVPNALSYSFPFEGMFVTPQSTLLGPFQCCTACHPARLTPFWTSFPRLRDRPFFLIRHKSGLHPVSFVLLGFSCPLALFSFFPLFGRHLATAHVPGILCPCHLSVFPMTFTEEGAFQFSPRSLPSVLNSVVPVS